MKETEDKKKYYSLTEIWGVYAYNLSSDLARNTP